MAKDKYRLVKNDYNEYQDLFFYSFDIEETASKREFLKREFDKSSVYGIKDKGQLMTAVTCLPYEVNFFGHKIPMAGIANVMSAPEYLKNNGIDTLMAQAFKDMYEEGTVLSYLGPFSYDYYRRFGYEQVFEHARIEMPFEEFSRHQKPLHSHIKRYDFSQAQEVIGDIFKRHNTSGGMIRKSWWWKNLPLWNPDHRLAVSYDETNEVNGYLRYEFKDNSFIVHELLWETPDAFLALMHFINKHRSIYQTLIIESADSSLRANLFLTNPLDSTTTIEPYMMARVVDLNKFMNQYPTKLENLKSVKIKINDILSWNDHIWDISIKDGEIKFAKDDKANPDMILDIQTLTQALFGYQTLNNSYLVGIIVGNLDKIKLLDQMFIHERSILNDAF